MLHRRVFASDEAALFVDEGRELRIRFEEPTKPFGRYAEKLRNHFSGGVPQNTGLMRL